MTFFPSPTPVSPVTLSVTALFGIIKCIFRENRSTVSLRHFTGDVTAVCPSRSRHIAPAVIFRQLVPQANNERWPAAFPVSCITLAVAANPGWFFPPGPGGRFLTVLLLIPRTCDIIGSWAPALCKHAGELGRMWLKLWSMVADMLESNRQAIVHAKPDCSGPAWGHRSNCSCKGTDTF